MDGLPTLISPEAPEARLLALSPDLLGAVGFDGNLRFLNPAWSATLGLDEDRLRAGRFLDLVHPGDRAATESVVGSLAAGGRVQEFVCRLQRADGSERSVLWSAQGSPQDHCFYLAGKDITERRRLEEELAHRAERLEHINAELQEFAYIASHDLAEPLRMITSYLELLERRYGGQLDDTADEFIGFAVGGARRMKALIDDLLAYSRVGSRELDHVAIDLADLLRTVLQGLERAIADAGATVTIAPDLAPVSGDPTQVGQLLQNLVSNAVKFRAPGRPPAVIIGTEEQDDGTRIDVTDNGIGIDPSQQDRIFKMFARLHGRDEYDGTGIGLALCRRISDRHGGRIAVRSAPDAGATFSVWLPRR